MTSASRDAANLIFRPNADCRMSSQPRCEDRPSPEAERSLQGRRTIFSGRKWAILGLDESRGLETFAR
jgi:hypothetical protein